MFYIEKNEQQVSVDGGGILLGRYLLLKRSIGLSGAPGFEPGTTGTKNRCASNCAIPH